jgi:hypothetical protein
MAEKIPGKPMRQKTFETEKGTPRPKSRSTTPEAIYSGRTRAPGASKDGDGLVSEARRKIETKLQKPQDRDGDGGEGRMPSYDNDSKGWSRGGPSGGEERPHFDHGPVHGIPSPTRGGKVKASGQDVTKSPFSAAGRNFGKVGGRS